MRLHKLDVFIIRNSGTKYKRKQKVLTLSQKQLYRQDTKQMYNFNFDLFVKHIFWLSGKEKFIGSMKSVKMFLLKISFIFHLESDLFGKKLH